MRLGLQVPNFTWPNDQHQLDDTFGLIAERAEHADFYSLQHLAMRLTHSAWTHERLFERPAQEDSGSYRKGHRQE
jgi:hypothetical protein